MSGNGQGNMGGAAQQNPPPPASGSAPPIRPSPPGGGNWSNLPKQRGSVLKSIIGTFLAGKDRQCITIYVRLV
ncbi:hypothetical protein AAHA92_20700 [Salvia divinorum]|uniref:Uncharacterized protein n=1 Tax=Salvia divinorum TaxID=28513 RepID=A0ABD1GI03_SALDI